MECMDLAGAGASMTSQRTDRGNERVLQAFADAWNRHDVDALMSMMTTDCVFESRQRTTLTDRG